MRYFDISPEAESDVVEIAAFLYDASARSALRFIDRYEKAVRQIREFPSSGQLDRALPLTTRIVVVGRWLLIYRFDDEAVFVQRVITGTANLADLDLPQ